MADYLVDSSKLTAIGDSLRVVSAAKYDVVYSQNIFSSNLDEEGNLTIPSSGSYPMTTGLIGVYTIDNYDEYDFVKLTGYCYISNSSDLYVWDGEHPSYGNSPGSYASLAIEHLNGDSTFSSDIKTGGNIFSIGGMQVFSIFLSSKTFTLGSYIYSSQYQNCYYFQIRGYKKKTQSYTLDEMSSKINNCIDKSSLKYLRLGLTEISNSYIQNIKISDYISDYSKIRSIFLSTTSNPYSRISNFGYFNKVYDFLWSGEWPSNVTVQTSMTNGKLVYGFRCISPWCSTTIGYSTAGAAPQKTSDVNTCIGINENGQLTVPIYCNSDSEGWGDSSYSYTAAYAFVEIVYVDT